MTPERASRNIAIASMLVSTGLATAKILVGANANSTAVISDGLESAGDVLASGLVLLGLVIASKPPDAQHPYGHGRVETLSALVVGMMLVISGSLISLRSMERSWESQPPPAAYAVWPLIVSIAVKGVTSAAKSRYARKIGSAGLEADAWNDRVDVFSGAVALTGLGLAVFGPKSFAAADHYGGAAVGLVVIFLGIRIVRDTTLLLIDTMPEPESMDQIRHVALSVPGARGIEKCFARKTGLRWHVDLHLEVDPDMSVLESHELATEVRIKIKETLDWVADVLVHVEPYQAAKVSNSSK